MRLGWRAATAAVLGGALAAVALRRLLQARRRAARAFKLLAEAEQREKVSQAYAATARGEAAQGCCQAPPSVEASTTLNYSAADVALGKETGADLGLGCGNPVALADLKKGEVVVDLGSGPGLDCVLAAKKVGPTGQAIGIDLTDEMLAKARAAAAEAGVANAEFRKGAIEALPVESGSVDAVISNCVVNLSPDKAGVCREAFRVLRPGGRVAVADVVRTQELPEHLKTEQALACWVAGAPPADDLAGLLQAAGFEHVCVVLKPESAAYIKDWMPGSGAEQYITAANVTAVKPGPAKSAGCWA